MPNFNGPLGLPTKTTRGNTFPIGPKSVPSGQGQQEPTIRNTTEVEKLHPSHNSNLPEPYVASSEISPNAVCSNETPFKFAELDRCWDALFAHQETAATNNRNSENCESEGMFRAYSAYVVTEGNNDAYERALKHPALLNRLRKIGPTKVAHLAVVIAKNAMKPDELKLCSKHANFLIYARMQNVLVAEFATWFETVTLNEAMAAVRAAKKKNRNPDAPMRAPKLQRFSVPCVDVEKYPRLLELSKAKADEEALSKVQQIFDEAFKAAEAALSDTRH